MPGRRVALAALALGSALLLSSRAEAGSGGPDAFGYTWRDINDSAGCPILGSGAAPANSGSFVSYVVGPIDLGFTFPFYDQEVTQVWFHQAGLVFFQAPPPIALHVNQDIPRAGDGIASFIAPHWSFLVNLTPNVEWESDAVAREFRVRFHYARPQSGTQPLHFEVHLDSLGDIRIEYLQPSDASTVTIGMEGPLETPEQSLKMRYNATQLGGMTYGNPEPFAICIMRPSSLSCDEPQAVACGSPADGASPAAIPENVLTWGCGSGTWAGKESVFSFEVTELSDLEISVSGTGARAMAAYLLDSCHENGCLAGGSPGFLAPAVTPGAYFIAVDAQTELDEGPFTLEVLCTPLTEPIDCGETLTGDTSGAPDRLSSHDCLPGDFSGGDDFYAVELTAPGPLSVSLASVGGQAAFILDASDPLAPDACLAGGVGGAVLWDAPACSYVVAVDGPPSSEGAYTLTVGCEPTLWCAGSGTIGCQQTIAGSTDGVVPRTTFYRCLPEPFDGPEAVFEFTLTATDTVSFVLESAHPGLDLILLDACDEGACLGSGDSVVSRLLTAGTYFVVVDGRNGASGDFTLSTVCGFGLEPEVLTITSAEGECFTEQKRAWLTPEMVRADILMALDLTGSMAGVRDQMIANINDLIDRLSFFIVDPAFALASHKDYPWSLATPAPCAYSNSYGGPGDYAYKLDQPMTTDRLTIEAAVASLDPAGGGGDLAESYNRLLYETVNDPNIAWRPNSRRILVAFGDELPHDCNVLECLGGIDSPRGVDPGRDELIGTPDDLFTTDVIQGLLDSDTVLLHLTNSSGSAGPYTYDEIWNCWSEATGGESAQLNNDGTVPSGVDLAELVSELVQTRGTTCRELQLVAEPGWEDWVESATPVYMDVVLPASVEFEITFCVPVGTPPGSYDFVVRLTCGDQIVTTQQVHVDVTEDCVVQNAAAPGDVTVVDGDATILDASGLSLVNCAGSDLYEWRDGRGAVVGSLPTVEVRPDADQTYTVSLTCSANPLCGADHAVDVFVEQRPEMQVVVEHCWCDQGLRLNWSPATFPSGSGFYNVYRS